MTDQKLEELLEQLDMEVGEETKKESKFDIKALIEVLWRKRRSFYISIPLALVISILLAFSMPKTYSSHVLLAPELSSMSSANGGLSNIMRSVGIRAFSGSATEGDAIMPNLYPDLVNSQVFLVSLFDIPVKSKDGKINTTYYEYLNKHQKTTWWSKAIGWMFSLLPTLDSDDKQSKGAEEKGINATALNRRQTNIVNAIASNVICDVDKKTYVITISVNAQDPVICYTVADSTCRRLQEFITDYRTKKARQEYEHIQEQYNTAKAEYETAKEKLAAYNDGNWDLVEEDFVLQRQALQNEMQLRFSALSTINAQMILARSKVDEAKPIFTVLDGATIPLKPTGPKKKAFVLGLVFLVCFVQSLLIIWKEIKDKKKAAEKQPADSLIS